MPKEKSEYTLNTVFSERLKKLLSSAKTPKELSSFAELLFQGVPTAELENHKDKDITPLIQEVFTFLKAPLKKGGIKLLALNPDFTHHSLLLMNMHDQPFLVDSVGLELSRRGIDIHHTFHPILRTNRAEDGTLIAFNNLKKGAAVCEESLIVIECDRQSEEELKTLQSALKSTISLAQHVVQDFEKLKEKMHDVTKLLRHARSFDHEEDMVENVSFLEWLLEDHFVFLGYRQYNLDHSKKDTTIQVNKGSGLGILRGDDNSSVKEETKLKNTAANMQHYMTSPQALTLTKAITKANIHRNVDMDYIGVKEFDDKGNVIREHRFLGLFTSKAYTCSVRDIPLVRQKIHAVLKAEEQTRGHSYRSLVNILETYPREELFQISVEDLHRIALSIVHLKDRPKTRLLVRRGAEDRLISAMVFMPRDRLTRINRNRISTILADAFDAEDITYNIHVSDSALARIFFMIRTVKTPKPKYSEHKAEEKIIEITSSWEDGLRHHLIDAYGEEEGIKLAHKYVGLFPVGYQDHTPLRIAIDDIREIEALLEEKDHSQLGVSLHHAGDDEEHASLRIFRREGALHLSSIMPILEKMGLYVHEERPNRVNVQGQDFWIHDFIVSPPQSATRELVTKTVTDRITQAIQLAWSKELEVDRLNSLITQGNLGVEAIIVLRAYVAYFKQVGSKYSTDYIRKTLVKHSQTTGRLWKLFDARFNTEHTSEKAQKLEKEALRSLEENLQEVSVLDEDIIFRRLIGTIKATKRTNVYVRDGITAPLAFKIYSAEVPNMPKPAPLYEIFVYHSAVEGIHLRGGKVARGGLRWSDREADFRTEVLSLMKTQMTKNAVIVPVGSKGGFVLKKAPCNLKNLATCDPQELKQAVVDAYKIFVRHLLVLTDNIKNNKIVPPKNIRRHDGDDPYLVVAADKGTATFSDLANSLSAERSFWLGDAFASGGSNGYDHKKMGITARGAWESVKRHFMEKGKDIQKESFTCFGIGDMGGDVFGNGMLLSTQTKLVAAFNHRHIFIDPTPDVKTSYEERKRLFEGVLGWDSYDTRKLSKGGDIFNRTDKAIKLSVEARQLLGVKKDMLSPDEVMTAILKMKADLFWNGGIGTFVKASDETDLNVGDRANDAIRINAKDLRVTAIGEGGNLGLTQRARIEAAQNGVLLNTDALDNSAGVDCSDHEVNIKILLDKAMLEGKISLQDRNKTLEEMTEDVAQLVLRDNILQSQLISFEGNLKAKASADAHLQMMQLFEKQDFLDRAVEALPDDEEMAKRIHEGQGLTRPELSVLMAYGKMDLYNNLIKSDLSIADGLEAYLVHYFPQLLQDKFKDEILNHPLRREIALTVLTNEMINRMGLSFIYRLRNETGYQDDTIARAFVITKALYDFDAEWAFIESLSGKVPALTQLEMLNNIKSLCEHTCLWLMRHGPTPLEIEKQIARFGPIIQILRDKLPKRMTKSMQRHHERRARQWEKKGLPSQAAERIARMSSYYSLQDIADASLATGKEPDAVMQLHFAVGEELNMELLHTKARTMPSRNYWERVANQSIVDSIYTFQKEAVLQAVAFTGKKGKATNISQVMQNWQQHKAHELKTFKEMQRELSAQDTIDHAMLNVVIGHLKTLTS